jgi:chromosome partitioning protein
MLLNIPSHPDLRKIVVLNPKGGSGKSTVATNLAGCIAASGHPVALMDFDPQGSAMRWLQNRSDDRPEVYGISAFKKESSMTRSWQLRVPEGIRHLVIDTPAALQVQDISAYTRGAHAILVPVLPSDIDIHAASRLIASMLIVAKVSRRMGRLGVIANRVRENTLGYRKLNRFLERLSISVVGELRDSQNYVHAADQGLSVKEMARSRAHKDQESWNAIISWLEKRIKMPITPRDLILPTLPAKKPAIITAGSAMSGYAFPRD